MENVVVLAHDEAVVLDGGAYASLEAQLGDAGAQGVVSRAMEEIANRLSLIERCYYQEDLPATAKAAKGLVGIAEQVGATSLARTSAAVSDCALGGDEAALAAVVSRLIRLGDQSLTAVWDMPELTVY